MSLATKIGGPDADSVDLFEQLGHGQEHYDRSVSPARGIPAGYGQCGVVSRRLCATLGMRARRSETPDCVRLRRQG